MYILGINAYHGDAAAAIVRDGELIAAVEEERFTRIKHCAGFPAQSIAHCLRAAGITIEQVEHVGISRNPAARLHKKLLAAGQRLLNRKSPAVAEQFATAAAGSERQTSTLSTVPRTLSENGGGCGGRLLVGPLKD